MDFDFMLGGGGSGGSRNVRPRKRRTKRPAPKTDETILTLPGFPNKFPFSEMLLDGKLKLGEYGVKTRVKPWTHRGLTLLYSSSDVAKTAVEAHGYNPKTDPRKVILGVGNLVDIRELTEAEIWKMYLQFNNTTTAGMRKILNTPGRLHVEPYPLGYFFTDLKRFEKPVPFAWPSGAVRTTKIPVSHVAKALKAVGIREVQGIRF